ncbi:hypothetical protein [Paraburkholderia aspalathi]|uniref:hypothetical protein n=1 Tax=Paraburkholderia aspalathi TaxID=1324617 RepID=UPI00190BD8CC|nr:hypothetical protein [Paraburkholderia aspalathi]MBK3844291.1 hypothetical protein [Paraburkholderia aspalathi]
MWIKWQGCFFHAPPRSGRVSHILAFLHVHMELKFISLRVEEVNARHVKHTVLDKLAANHRKAAGPGGRSNSSGYGHFKLPHLTTVG